jgi:hypothetical protein
MEFNSNETNGPLVNCLDAQELQKFRSINRDLVGMTCFALWFV